MVCYMEQGGYTVNGVLYGTRWTYSEWCAIWGDTVDIHIMVCYMEYDGYTVIGGNTVDIQ